MVPYVWEIPIESWGKYKGWVLRDNQRVALISEGPSGCLDGLAVYSRGAESRDPWVECVGWILICEYDRCAGVG